MPALAAAPRGDQRLPRSACLRQRGEFDRCYSRGRRRSAATLVVHWAANAEPGARLGVTVTKKIGTSVVRHRLKRWAREIFRRSAWRATLPGGDLVVHYRAGAGAAAFSTVHEELERILGELAAGPKR